MTRMNRLQQIYLDLAAGTLSKEEALAGIRALKLSQREAGLLRASPVWQEAVQDGREPSESQPRRHVFLCDLPGVDAVQLEALLPNSRCVALRTAPQKNIAERFSEFAVTFFEQMQELLRDRPEGQWIVQIVIADDEESRVLTGLSALLKTAALEHPSLAGQCVITPPRVRLPELARMLKGGVPTPGEALVRFDLGVRQVSTWQEVPAGESAAVAFKDHGVYLITGGLGGLAARFAREILEQTTHAKVILAGRTPVAGQETALSRSYPRRVEYRAADVCDAQAVERLIADIHQAHGQLNGILHCAGTIADNFMLKKTPADFREVLAPKVIGTFNLDQASQQADLDFLALFSSIAAVMGNAGQADYAAANGFMDQFAAYRNRLVAGGHRAGRTVSINWPYWLEGGMTLGTAQRESLRRSSGIEPLGTANGMRAFYECLQSSDDQLLVMEGDLSRLRGALVRQSLQAEASPTSTPALAPMPAAPAAAAAPAGTEDLLTKTTDYLRDQFAVLLKMPARRIDPDAGLERYGIDSILAVDLITRLEKTFGPLSKTLLFEYQTISGLAEYFARAHAPKLAGMFSATVTAEPAEPMRAKPSSKRKIGRFVRPKAVAEPSADPQAIAIVGLSGRYPQADDVDAFWQNLSHGLDCITEVPASRWDWREYFSEDRTQPGHHFSKWGGFISGVDEFDPLFFNISPREAKNIDPQERLFLQHAWLAIEDAGYTRASLQLPHGRNQAGQVGVYAGAMHSEYQLFGAEASAQGSRMAVSSSFASIANRVSYALNLHGPSLTLDTMCSSSLTAIHIACQDLRQGRTSLAIAGGVNVSIHPNKYLLLSAGQFISSDGHCQSFGEGGDGYIPGEGVGVVILKRLSDAERDGNQIYGVIRGTALNHGGKTNGYTVPNPQAQADVIRQALEDARIEPRQVSYIEAHGTGTRLGDPIEIAALAQAFRGDAVTDEVGFCALGSAKSNIGHCESAAGIAGLTKVLLQMKHRLIAPSLHSTKLNPHIDFPSTPFVVNQTLRDWPQPVLAGRRLPRIAGLSSFGAGGSNAHLIIEEYSGRDAPAISAPAVPCIVPLSARTPAQLQQRARDLLAYLGNLQQPIDLPSLAYTLQVGREAMDARLGLIVESLAGLSHKLERFLAGDTAVDNVFQGLVDRHAGPLSFKVDQEMAERNLPKLLELWVSGLELAWEKLSEGAAPRLMSLPGYPFAREKYWLERPANNVPAAQAASLLHPLVHTNTSTLDEHSFASTFRGTESFLRVDAATAQKVLPALAGAEMMRAAVELVSPQPAKSGFWEFRDIHWGSPVVAAGVPVRIGLQAAQGGVIDMELFTGADDDAGEVIHCQAEAAFDRTAAPARLDVAQLKSVMTQSDADVPGVLSCLRGEGQWLATLNVTGRVDLMAAVTDLMLHLFGQKISFMSAECVRAVADSPVNPLVWVRSAVPGTCDIDVLNESGEVCAQMLGLQYRSAAVVEMPAPLVITAKAESPAAPRKRVTVALSDPAASEVAPVVVPAAATAVAAVDGVFSIELKDNAVESALHALERVREETSLKVLLLNIERGFDGGRSACNLAIESSLFNAIASFPYPVVAVMRGDVRGAGFLAASLCDLMVLSEEGRYGFADAAQKLFPTSGEERFLRARFDDVSMDDFLYQPAPLTGRELKARGWTCRIVPAARIDSEARELAADLARKSPLALRLLKAHLARELLPMVAALEVVDTNFPEDTVDDTRAATLVPANGIDVEVGAGGVAIVRLTASSLNLETLVAELRNVIEAIDQRPSCRAIVLASEHAGFLPRADRDIEKEAALHLKMLLQSCRLPLIAAFTGNAEGLAWLAGMWCDACVYHANGQYGAGGPWTTPWPAQEVASLFVRRLGRSLGEEACLTTDAFTGADLRARVPALSVAEAAEVIPQALRWASFWTAWPRETLSAWKQARVGRAEEVLKELPTWQDWEEKEAPVGNPVALSSSAVTLTAHPDGVVVIAMQDREAKNLFSDALISGLKEAFAHIEQTPAYKVVVLTGYDNYFASGGTKETLLAIHEGKTQFTDERVFQLPMDCTLPVIAAMQGHAIGGGWSFGMFADLVMLSEESRYASPYMGYGFTPGAGATLVFPGKIGHDLARETLLLAREMSGHELEERGLSAPVAPRREVVPAALALARRIARRPRVLLKNLKRQWVHALRRAREETLELEVGMHEQTFVGRADTLEHIHAKFNQGDAAPVTAQRANAGLEMSAVLESLRQLLARELHMQPEDINERAQFTDLGLDSITGVTWIRHINVHYGTSIEATRIYSYPTLAELARFVKSEAEKAGAQDPVPAAPAIVERAALATAKTTERTVSLAPAAESAAPAPAVARSLVSRRRSRAARQRQRIAVIGMAGQFPKANGLDEFWTNIATGRDCISEVPQSRWSLDEFYQQGAAVSGKTNSKWLGALQDYDRFDPLFFNISPIEAECMDPQQRVFLQACWHGIENAGYDSQSLSGSRCGVFVGCAGGDYHQLPRKNPLSAQDFTGVATSILAARISYLLNLRGPCISFDTACSSSLVAIANACDSLNAGNSDLALAGGVYVGSGPSMHIMTSQAGMLSADGRCFSFDERANGFVIGEGVGVLVLKRLADAERDQDRILGVLEGWGVNQDGKTNGITAPNEDSQARLLQSVYEQFDLDPGGIQLIEAHGTGTRLGDPIEIAGLKAAFKSVSGAQRCALGSVKSNIGHCLTAAGVAGVIKLMLALKHRQLPPTVHFARQNEHITLTGSPFYVNDSLKDWNVAEGQTRRAAVSSFGFSGTNAHIVVAEHAPSARVRPPVSVVLQDDKLIVPLSARTEAQLEQKARDLLDFIRANDTVSLVDLAYTLQVGRDPMNERVGFLVGTVAALAHKLEAWLAGGKDLAEVYRGQVKQGKDELKLLVQDDEMRAAFLGKWLAQRKLGKLLELWVKGLSVDWNALYGAARPRRIELPAYPFARDRYWIETAPAIVAPETQAGSPAGTPAEPSAGSDWDGLSYVYRWEERIDSVRQLPSAHKTVLIVGDDSFLEFEATIREQYKQARVVQIQLADGAHTASAFATALQSVPKIDALYFLASHRCDELALLRLVKYLKQERKVEKTDAYILTRDVHCLNEDSHYAGAGAAGLAYSLAQGNHQFQVRNLDLSSGDLRGARGREQLFSIISREPPSDRGEVFRIESGRRFQRTFLKLNWGSPAPAAIKQGGVYVIAGGSGIVGRIFTRYLHEKYRAKVVWLGRSAEGSPAVDAAMREFGDLPPDYVQADVSDLESMRRAIEVVKRKHGAIHGAIFSAMVFGTDNSIDQITESQFESVAGVKTRGGLTFHAALASEPLDFLCYLSSGQAYSFSGASRVAAYAAGISFSDSFVRSLRGQGKFPVGTINWGAWAAFVKERMQGREAVTSMGAFDDSRGFECFERFVGALQQGSIHQVLCMRTSAEVQALMNCNQHELVTLAAPTPGAAISVLPELQTPHEKIARLKDIRAASQIEQWFAQLLTCQFTRMFEGSGAAPATLAELQAKARIQGKYLPWVTQALDFLAERNCLEWRDGAIRGWNAKASKAKWQEWQTQREVYAQDPETRALAVLVNDCLENLPDIMQGRRAATDVIFPNSSMEKVASLYKNNAVADTFNEMVADAALVYLRRRLQADPNTRIRILEIGAGTGGTSAAVFGRLRPFQQAVEEYCYTDLSKAFFLHAEEHYKPANPYLVCRRLDIEQSIESQGIDVGSYDLVIATNVLHATRDIRRTLRNAKAAMRRNGLLLLNEMSDKTLTTHLTVALLDGWWLFEDPELRIPGCPGLYPESWRRVLAEEGFSPVQFPAESAHVLGNQIIVARSDGIVRQTAAPAVVKHPRAGVQELEAAPASVMAAEAAPGMPADDFVRGVIRECLSGTLKVAARSIEADSAFSDYGVDSILGVSFVKQLSERLRIPLNTAIIFEYSSMERLSKHIVATYGEDIARLNTHVNTQAPVRPAATPSLAAVEVKRPAAEQRATPEKRATSVSAGIAVVGMSGQFPKAANVREFWNNLVAGVDGVEELPAEYLTPSFYDPRKQKGKTRCKWGGVLTERDCFDPLFFNISPREAEAMNPHQRLVMQESWNAIEDAGYNPKSLAGTRTGIFVGAEPTGYAGETFTGVSEAIIASRLSYVLNLNGPAFVVNTGCSSSGVALHLACESLRNQETDVVLAGGVHACMSQATQIRLDEIEMVSPSGRCFTFDQAGDGTIISEGIGMVVLKRLEDAIAAGDHIYGTIRGSGINQDGASNGITAPNGAAQEQLIRDVYDKFGIDAENISYIEAHGTGTKLGDPVETNALVRAFRKYTSRQNFCAVGSAKSHIGHTAAAAGVTGLIKVLLSMQHRQLPGLLNFKTLNPLIEFRQSPFYIPTETTEWNPSGGTRMAALNSFGHSGTNVHLVIEEHSPASGTPREASGTAFIIPLSAKSREQLRQKSRELLEFIRGSDLKLASLAYTLQVGREAMEERTGYVVRSVGELADQLESGAVRRSGADDAGVADADLQAQLDAWIAGSTLDWKMFWRESTPERVNLPGYPFARERYWAGLVSAETSARNPMESQPTRESIADIIGRIADESLDAGEGIKLLRMAV
jgi:acyl transferase domain-containing protein/enoyl-CoA hydratase/carnithine racemase/NAD(P)-dependent dehydrogenase (short-subunit alcohol dehydrogenase family)/acyl carrier protein/2-polyprenyl-3-methyl-5-hydroxy-6-metoxy-1,4-benzoquinol methylase